MAYNEMKTQDLKVLPCFIYQAWFIWAISLIISGQMTQWFKFAQEEYRKYPKHFLWGSSHINRMNEVKNTRHLNHKFLFLVHISSNINRALNNTFKAPPRHSDKTVNERKIAEYQSLSCSLTATLPVYLRFIFFFFLKSAVCRVSLSSVSHSTS